MPKFLILRFSSIGDIVLTTPVVRCLKKQVAGAEVHFATKKGFSSFLEPNPYIDRLHLLDKSDSALIEELKKENFDYVIDLHHNLRTQKIKWALGVKSYSFDKLNVQKWLLVNFKINRLPKVHIVDRYLDTLKSFGVQNDNLGLDYVIPDKDQYHDQNLERPFVAFAIGGQHATKKLPTHRIIELCKRLPKQVVLLGGKEDAEAGDAIAQATGAYNLCGKLNLNQSASVVQQAEKLYTHDTGLMHIAAALKKTIVSIWGNTVPEFGMTPYQTEHEIWENRDISCRPCSKIGHKKCPKGHFKCMEALKFDLKPQSMP